MNKTTLFTAFSLFLISFNTISVNAQNEKKSGNSVRPISALINENESALAYILDLSKTAKNKVTILQVDSSAGRESLFQTQVTTKSPMGAIICYTGGIQINNGLIRILGSGNANLTRSLPLWNKGKSFKEFGETPGFLLVADDAIGGLFAINGGALKGKAGNIFYFAPDNLVWQDLNIGYTEFIEFCFNGDVDKFYKDLKWVNFENDLVKVNGDQAISFSPPLWSKEGVDIEKNKKEIINMEQLYYQYQDILNSPIFKK